jgi:hypothetical protein
MNFELLAQNGDNAEVQDPVSTLGKILHLAQGSEYAPLSTEKILCLTQFL